MSNETTTSGGTAESGRYPFREIERKWQARWDTAQLHRTPDAQDGEKYYVLVMFPYPSGSGLHVGHCKNYVPGDVVARFKRMQGFCVLNPMGWDAFGQPAEQDAILRGVNPRAVVPILANEYRRQLTVLGVSYDWDREINSTDPNYYRWNQWAFLKLYENQLAYRDFAPVNWCVDENTVLANEEVNDGRCWRCGGPVIQKPLPQWKFRITAYADKLLAGLETIDWPEGVKIQQRDWIGRSEGAEVTFRVDGGSSSDTIAVFTTRPDTLWGATFLVLSPEHPLVDRITTPAQRAPVDAYRAAAQAKTDDDRTADGKEKTGVFTGAHAVNPVNGDRIPIWIADYVLVGYGTGAIMAVPAHDQRDFEFARAFGLPITLVYRTEDDQTGGSLRAAAPTGGAFAAELGAPFTGAPNDKSTVRQVIAWLEAQGIGTGRVQYRLRDWLVSRQRYWGTPIPMIHCPACGIVPVPENQLPVVLPDVENYKPGPDGRSPLASILDWVRVPCPRCGGAAERETDTMAGSVDSSWYFLRFTSPHEQARPWDPAAADYWMPVDMYIGGREHAVGHLLYSRFFTKVFHDLGLCAADEPALRLRNQGMLNALTPLVAGTDKAIKPGEFVDYPRDAWIERFNTDRRPIPAQRIARATDGTQSIEPVDVEFAWLKMSKSKGTSVTPDDMAEKYGADALRLYVLFEAPFEDTIQWSEERMNGTYRFLNRAWDTVMSVVSVPPPPGTVETLPGVVGGDLPDNWAPAPDAAVRALRRRTHQTIAKVTDDIEGFRFNTAVSALMIHAQALRDFVNAGYAHHPAAREAAEALTLLLAPMAPHIADELWERLGHAGDFLFTGPWPVTDPAIAAEDEVTLIVQVNGKLRDRVALPAGADDDACQAAALGSPKVQSELSGKTIRKIIVVPGKLVNIVV